jgi:AcrR family transcriptional regulator
MGRTKDAHRLRREEIIRTSALLFEKVGYHGASMQVVAAAVKLSKPTLYHYFRSKNEILYAIHEDLIASVFASHAARAARRLPLDALLVGICTDILAVITEHPGYTRAFFEHHDELDDDQRKTMRLQRRKYLKLVRDLIGRGVEAGTFAPCDTRLAALGFLGMCNWAYKWAPGEKNFNVEKTARMLCAIFLSGLKKR